MPDVISNTSPLQYLHQVGLLHLLPALFGQVCVPNAVVQELEAGRHQGVNLPVVETLDWLHVRTVVDQGLLSPLMELGAGEKEVLALGMELSGALLLLDDRDARRHARTLNLDVSGTLGVLLLAKEQCLLKAVQPILDRLQGLGFRLDPRTRQDVLQLAEETS